MKTAREYWETADRVAARIRKEADVFSMGIWFRDDCGTPSCVAGHLICEVGARYQGDNYVVTPTGKRWVSDVAQEALGLSHKHLFHVAEWPMEAYGGKSWQECIVDSEAAIRAMYFFVEEAHGPRPTDVPVYTIPNWRRVVREMELEEAGVGG